MHKQAGPTAEQTPSAAVPERMVATAEAMPGLKSVSDILTLQRAIGNRAVARLLSRQETGRERTQAHDPAPADDDQPASERELPSDVERAVSGGGVPLDPATRQEMEDRFGTDLGSVRIHAGADAEASAQEQNALAYTLGTHIVFATGRYQPRSPRGRMLLAHELSHVLQSRAAASNPAQPSGLVSSLEGEAEQVAAAFGSGVAMPSVHGTAGGLAVPLRVAKDYPGTRGTYGDIDVDLARLSPQQRKDVQALHAQEHANTVELRQATKADAGLQAGKWYEFKSGQPPKQAEGVYSFVVKDGRIYGSRFGHKAAAGPAGTTSSGEVRFARVDFAGEVAITTDGSVDTWSAGSGTYKPPQSPKLKMHQPAIDAGLPEGRYRPLQGDLPKKRQLPVIQPGQEGAPGAGSNQPKPAQTAPPSSAAKSPTTGESASKAAAAQPGGRGALPSTGASSRGAPKSATGTATTAEATGGSTAGRTTTATSPPKGTGQATAGTQPSNEPPARLAPTQRKLQLRGVGGAVAMGAAQLLINVLLRWAIAKYDQKQIRDQFEKLQPAVDQKAQAQTERANELRANAQGDQKVRINAHFKIVYNHEIDTYDHVVQQIDSLGFVYLTGVTLSYEDKNTASEPDPPVKPVGVSDWTTTIYVTASKDADFIPEPSAAGPVAQP